MTPVPEQSDEIKAQTRALNEIIFDRLMQPGDPIKVLETKIKIDSHVAKQCRADGTIGLAKAYEAQVRRYQAELDALKAKL